MLLCSHPKLVFLGDGGNTLGLGSWPCGGVTGDPAVQWSLLGEGEVYCLGKPVHPTRLELCWGGVGVFCLL